MVFSAQNKFYSGVGRVVWEMMKPHVKTFVFFFFIATFNKRMKQQMNSRVRVKKLYNLTRDECNRIHDISSVLQIDVAAPWILMKTKHIFTFQSGHFPGKESKSFRRPKFIRTSYISKL
jgi:hypothetical protein